MDAIVTRKTGQTYEVDDFQHNFEVSRNRSETDIVSSHWGIHIHSTYYEVLVFVCGNVDFWIEGRRKKLEYGDVVIVNPREIHRIYLYDDSLYDRIVIHVSDSTLKDISTAQTNILRVFHKNKAHILHFTDEEMKQFLNNHHQMPNLWNKKEFGADILGDAWLQILMIQIAQKMRQAEGEGEQEVTIGLVGKTLEYINENLTKDISAQDIADALNVSRSYLSHMFKKSTGYGLWNYVITKRLVYAQKLLFGGSSVTEACYESGFKDYAHFIKSFTKKFGCSPKQCKKVETDSYMMKLNL